MTEKERDINKEVEDSFKIELFTNEQRSLLSAYRNTLSDLMQTVKPCDEEDYHTLMLYCMAVAMTELPVHQQNIYIMSILYPSMGNYANSLHVSRQTLVRYIMPIKQRLQERTLKLIKIYQ